MRAKLPPERSITALPSIAARRIAAAAAGWALAACSPALDWRSVPMPATQFVTDLPCRPGTFERHLRLAGAPLTLFMLSCEAGGVTYGVATAEVGDPALVDPVLHALFDAARDAIRSSGEPGRALNIGGTTPFSGSSSAHLHGRRPDGGTVDEAIHVFARGARVFQASAIGAVLPDEALAPFEAGLRFALEKPPSDLR